MSVSEGVSRLPVTHPDFRYRESANPYWRRIQGNPRIVVDGATEERRGRWRQAFGAADTGSEPRVLHVEVGCNAGHVVTEWARRRPDELYLGLDWKFKIAHRAAEKAEKAGLANFLMLRAHAERLPYIFGPGEVDHLHLFFPDPWPKQAQWKHRYIQSGFLDLVHPLISARGDFHIKTDHDGYFDWILEALSRAALPWEVVAQTRDLHAGNPDAARLGLPEVTLFERLFIADGVPIKSVRLRPRRT